MAPRRKTRSMTTNRQDAPEPTDRTLRRKVIGNETDIDEWVYRFLGNLAAIEKDKEDAKKRNTTLKTSDRSQSLKAARIRLRSPTPYAWSPYRHPVDSDNGEDDALISPMSKARTRVAKALSIDGPRIVHRDPTLLQKINRYIRAGIAEDTRRAKRYVRKALSFAIETGYITPADRDGKWLRVSPALLATGKPLVDAITRNRRPRRQRNGRSGRVTRRNVGKRKTTTNNTSRRRAKERLKSVPAAAGDDASNAEGTSIKKKKSEALTQSKAPSQEEPNKSNSGSRKSSSRPSSYPSRRNHQRPIEDLAPIMPRIESSEANRKPLSARSRPPSFAHHSHDNDLLA